MRKVLIVGAGQAGLHLALGLQQRGYDVTVVSARTADEIEHGNVMSSQFQFDSTLRLERDLGIYFWDGQPPHTPFTRFMLGAGGPTPAVEWSSPLKKPGADIDQRVKMSHWLRLFEGNGGNLIVRNATVSDVDRWAGEYDLVVVAAGKGRLAEMFERDAARSPYTEPQRMLSLVYVNGFQPDPAGPGDNSVDFHLLPGLGEMIVMPALTVSGPCHVLFFEALPGGELDVFGDVSSPSSTWSVSPGCWNGTCHGCASSTTSWSSPTRAARCAAGSRRSSGGRSRHCPRAAGRWAWGTSS